MQKPIRSIPSTGHDAEFDVDTEIKDVEVLHVTSRRILARGRRFGRFWLLRALPPELRTSAEGLNQLHEEFDRRYSQLNPGTPLTVGIEEVEGLGPCIVEEWKDDVQAPSPIADEKNNTGRKHRLTIRTVLMILAALTAAGCTIAAGIHIRRLSELSKTTEADLEGLRRVNREGEEKMWMLADSLDRVSRGPMIPEVLAELPEIKEPDEQEKMAMALYKKKMKEFDKELIRYDRYIIPEAADSLPLFYDTMCALYRHILSMGDDADPEGYFSQLLEDDRIRLTCRIYGGSMLRAINYLKVWIPKANAADRNKRELIQEMNDNTK